MNRVRFADRLLVSMSFVLSIASAGAQSLEDSLVGAYASNATLDAAKQELRAANESVPQAIAGYRPNLSAFTQAGGAYEFTDDAATATAALGVTLTQPLYRGGRTSASVDSAEHQVFSQREIYRSTEQDILLRAANAHLDVLRDQQIVDLSRKNEAIINEQVTAFRRQLEAKAATKTDVAQGEVRLVRAQAAQVAVAVELAASRGVFREVVGSAPELLEAPDPHSFVIPASRDEVITRALQDNPIVAAANYAELASRFDVAAANGWRLPQVDLVGSAQYFSENAGGEGVDLDEDFAIGRVDLRITLPLYEGTYGSRSRQSIRVADQRHAELLAARRQVERNAAGAWERWQSANLQVQSLTDAVALAGTAADGLRREHRLGERTALDLLNGEQELLDAEIDLVRARRDRMAARFELLAVIGAFTVDRLQLDTRVYDVDAEFHEVRNSWL